MNKLALTSLLLLLFRISVLRLISALSALVPCCLATALLMQRRQILLEPYPSTHALDAIIPWYIRTEKDSRNAPHVSDAAASAGSPPTTSNAAAKASTTPSTGSSGRARASDAKRRELSLSSVHV